MTGPAVSRPALDDAVWWGREAGPGRRASLAPSPYGMGRQPELVDAAREAARAAISSRIATFTADWTNPTRADAGVALVRLFGLQIEPILRRANRLPEKALVEHLRVAGIGQLPATAAAALVQLSISDTATGSVLVPAGFQIGAGADIVFETDETVHATPATLTDLAVQDGGLLTAVAVDAPRTDLFGPRPRPGNALYVGLSVPATAAAPFPELSFGIVLASTAVPQPVVAGGIGPPPGAPPLLAWEVLDGGVPVPAELLADGTGGLRNTGVVRLGVPRQWRPAPLPGAQALPVRHWLRVRLVHGEPPSPPVLAGVRVNIATATAVRTVRDEVPERIPDGPDSDGGVRMRLRQAPVLAGSLVLEADDAPGGDLFGTATGGPAQPWREVESLAGSGPDDRVYVLDHETGEITFGDGRHGARVPDGFRTVRAVRYLVGGGRAGHVAADAISAPLTSIPSVTGAGNPFPASGGTDVEPVAQAVRRGPDELRAGGRAVAPADYGLLARRAPGADVARAEGVRGLHPDLPGLPVPGVVGVLVVAPDRGTGGPPLPSAGDLRAVTRFLTREAAPAGITVVAGAPRFQLVSVRTRVVLDPDRDAVAVLRAIGAALDRYLHPLTGGDAGVGWPLGGPVRHVALVRTLLQVEGLLAVPLLTVSVDGRQHPACTDAPIAANALLWPARHELVPVGAEVAP